MTTCQSPPIERIVLNISGEITVAAPRESVFKALSDAPFFASCIEGVQDLKKIDAIRYDAVLETRIAYMRFKFKVVVEMTKLSPPEVIEATVEGTPLVWCAGSLQLRRRCSRRMAPAPSSVMRSRRGRILVPIN